MRVLCLHGLGGHDADPDRWQPLWREAVGGGLRAAGVSDPVVDFLPYDDLFAAAPPSWRDAAAAVGKLARSAWRSRDELPHEIAYGREGVLDGVGDRVRWTAGMVVQWVEDADLRRAVRDRFFEHADGADVVIGHSLGSLIAYDALTDPEVPPADRPAVPALVTCGSQLANPFVLGNLRAGRLDVPAGSVWYHLHNPHDDVFVRPVRLSSPAFVAIETRFDIPGFGDHAAAVPGEGEGRYGYLDHPAARARLWPALAGRSAGPHEPESPAAGPSRTAAAAARLAGELAGELAGAPAGAAGDGRGGRRRAALVGVADYPNPADRLEGCVNDVFRVSETLQECGFAPEEIRVVLDRNATRAAILDRLEWLLAGAADGDRLVFYFSGHGVRLPLRDGPAGVVRVAEGLAPADFTGAPGRAVTDADLVELYSQLPYGVDFLMAVDCCHAGGVSRSGAGGGGGGAAARALAPPDDVRHELLRWDAASGMWVPRDFEPAVPPGLTADDDRMDRLVGTDRATLRLGVAAPLRRLDDADYKAARERFGHRGPYLPTVLHACRPEESAYEYRHGAVTYGAFTFALTKNLRRAAAAGRTVTFRDLTERTSEELRRLGYAQHADILGPDAVLAAPVPWVGGG